MATPLDTGMPKNWMLMRGTVAQHFVSATTSTVDGRNARPQC
jgi:hypothetical protein